MAQTTLKPVDKGLTAETELERMLAYNVDDLAGNRIGHVSGLWVDSRSDIEFVGVKTTWLVGKTHVFPAQGMQVNHQREIIRTPYHEDVIKNAPAFDPGDELNESQQQEIWTYYSRYGLKRGQTTQAQGSQAGAQTREEARIQLAEEQLKVGKRQVEVQGGGVRLRKIVRTQPVQQNVELKREEIRIERVPAGQAGQGTPAKAFQGEDIYIPLRREEAVIQKEPKVREEVRVGKKTETERKTISEQVRKEELETVGSRSAEQERRDQQRGGNADRT